MKIKYLLGWILLSLVHEVQAQDIGFGSIFRPGMRVGAFYVPNKTIEDNQKMEMLHVRSSLIVPLGGKASLSFKKLKAEAKQHFLNISAGYRQNEWSVLDKSSKMTNFSLGVTGVRAKLGNGIWAYSANAGFIRDEHSEDISPFALAALLKIKVKGLNKQNFLGGAIAYSGRRPLIIPIVGWRRRIARKTHLTALLPIQIDITKKISKTTKISFLNTINGFANQIKASIQSKDESLLQTFGGLKHSLIINYRISKNLRFLLEGGAFSYAKLQIFDKNRERRIIDSDANFSPFFSVSARINFGKSLIGSQLFGNDG